MTLKICHRTDLTGHFKDGWRNGRRKDLHNIVVCSCSSSVAVNGLDMSKGDLLSSPEELRSTLNQAEFIR